MTNDQYRTPRLVGQQTAEDIKKHDRAQVIGIDRMAKVFAVGASALLLAAGGYGVAEDIFSSPSPSPDLSALPFKTPPVTVSGEGNSNLIQDVDPGLSERNPALYQDVLTYVGHQDSGSPALGQAGIKVPVIKPPYHTPR